jgi:hypothetical protein
MSMLLLVLFFKGVSNSFQRADQARELAVKELTAQVCEWPVN